ncbi:O antigen flippase [Gracilinema caldarium]|uniref:O antigen flippase n=1 Tax=Gracilinema caldarium (strain ATCC 51460 / DSM 7334 / H1) TaxID=744872 RepID=F8F026_GRAC1|nr:O antigen flippase [Gracilinema caldarium]AEJ18679.1 O antigen flippase [Gracilinema caldarium DSM 7334]
MKIFKTAFANLLLRGASLGSRFVLLFVLGKFLDAEAVGMYGLILAYITYAIYALGFEYYNYSTRELIIQNPENRFSLLMSQMVFFGVVYAVVLPLLSFIFVGNLLPWKYALWFYGILIFEHLSHEVNRALIAISEPFMATLILFIKTGAWAIILSVLLILFPAFRTLEILLLFWLSGVALATAWGAFVIVSKCHPTGMSRVSWAWIIKGIKVAFPLLIASLSLRGMYSLDKIFMEKVAGLAVLGAYTLFSSVSNAVIAFIDAGLIVFYYPKIILAATKNNNISGTVNDLFMRVLLFSIFLVAGGMVVTFIALPYLGKAVYIDYFYMLVWQMGSAFLYCLGVVPQLGLYGMGKDMDILLSHLLSLVVFIIAFLILKPYVGVYSVLLSQCMGFAVMVILKCAFNLKAKSSLVMSEL